MRFSLSLELAKTAMRAMIKYTPIELVKQLYQSNKEPVLGGKIEEVSILFSDIYNFTSIAEKIPVNELAQALGSYLKVMTQAIQNNGQGIIDKYIGDGIMALWNTPTAIPNHTELACLAILDCIQRLEELFASAQWQHLPRFETRFGLHKDRVMVGHFGAPDRLNFTALGNGVNVASRLESLNKQYGTTILVSESVFEATEKNFTFRLIDFIVVKGKTEGIKIYELVGKKGEKSQLSPIISKYEEAFKDIKIAISLMSWIYSKISFMMVQVKPSIIVAPSSCKTHPQIPGMGSIPLQSNKTIKLRNAQFLSFVGYAQHGHESAILFAPSFEIRKPHHRIGLVGE